MNHVRWDSDVRYEDVLAEISKDQLWEYTQNIVSHKRETGSDGERQAMDYIQNTLEGYGISTRMYTFDSFVGLPEDGEVSISGADGWNIRGRPPAFSAQTPEEGVEAELVYAGKGTAEDLASTDVRGRFALVDGLATPHLSRFIEDKGALGLICIGGENIREMIITSIWGTPTPETAGRIPELHVLSIAGSDGDRLKKAVVKGTIRVRMKVNAFVGWKEVRIVLAHIEGSVEPERYAMLCGHVDSWHYGANDNGATNAAMMEAARVMNIHRSKLRRSIKIAFWTSHSHGRYAGSTWYADNFWEDLYRNCIGNITVDMVGCKGSADYTKYPRLAVTKACASQAVFETTGQQSEGSPFGRAGDQSFWGIGIPTLFGTLSRPSEEQADVAASLKSLLGNAAHPWWWHTVDDTIDKVDPDVMAKDTEVMSLAACYFCMNTVLPLDFVDAGQEIVDLLLDLKKRAGEAFSLDDTIKKAQMFMEAAEAFHTAVSGEALTDADKKKTDLVNQTLMRLSRIIVPIVQTAVNPFDHDLALPTGRLPTLQPVADLAGMDAVSDDARFLKTRLVRERNRVDHALLEAREVADTALEKIKMTSLK